MENYNYDAIISGMVEDLKERVKEGQDVFEAAHELVDGSEYVIYTKHHYKILDICDVDPAKVVSEFGIEFDRDFDGAIAQTVFGCLYRDMMDEYHDTIEDEEDEEDEEEELEEDED